MEYRQLGKWGARVSCLGMGSYLTIGMACDKETSQVMVREAIDAGINYFDTANAYNLGQAEIALGECLADYPRSSLFVLTKVFAPMGDGPNDRGLSAKHIREQCDASLKRLGMDYVDVYMCHRPDPCTPLEETIRAMEDLIRSGKVLYWGFSEWPSSLIMEADGLVKAVGARPPVVSQPRYNLLYRHPEDTLFPTTAKLGIGNVTFSPLAHGVLTGKYKPGETPAAGTRAADPKKNTIMMELYWSDDKLAKALELGAMGADHGVGAAEMALAWCLSNLNVSSVILGTTRVEQLRQNLKALSVKLSDEELRRIDMLFPKATAGPAF